MEIFGALLDLDDTLHDDTLSVERAARDVTLQLAPRLGVDGEKLIAAFIEALESFWQQHDPAALTEGFDIRTEMWDRALDSFGVRDREIAHWAATKFDAYRKTHYRLLPGVFDALADLRSAGLKLGLLSNGLRSTHIEKINILNIAQYFDRIFLSDDIGLAKPEPAIFMHACRELSISPECVAMVGDRYDKDIAGAIKAGMPTVWVNPHGRPLPGGCAAPTFTVDSIRQLPGLLRRLPHRL